MNHKIQTLMLYEMNLSMVYIGLDTNISGYLRKLKQLFQRLSWNTISYTFT